VFELAENCLPVDNLISIFKMKSEDSDLLLVVSHNKLLTISTYLLF
jgi:hypothetical protein